MEGHLEEALVGWTCVFFFCPWTWTWSWNGRVGTAAGLDCLGRFLLCLDCGWSNGGAFCGDVSCGAAVMRTSSRVYKSSSSAAMLVAPLLRGCSGDCEAKDAI